LTERGASWLCAVRTTAYLSDDTVANAEAMERAYLAAELIGYWQALR
jgi:hypothetical protein